MSCGILIAVPPPRVCLRLELDGFLFEELRVLDRPGSLFGVRQLCGVAGKATGFVAPMTSDVEKVRCFIHRDET
jgi:hypothetical protein